MIWLKHNRDVLPRDEITSQSIKGFRSCIILHGVGSVVKVFDNRVPRRIFGPKRIKVTGEWRKLHKVEPYDLYSSPNIIWVIKSRWLRWAGNVAHMGERRGVYRVLVGKPEGKRPLGRPRFRWEDNIKMYHQEVGWGGGGMDWIDLAKIGTGGPHL